MGNISTLDLNKIVEKYENLYEFAVVIAKRSRQINDDIMANKIKYEVNITEEDDGMDEINLDVSDELFDERADHNPASIALEEVLDNKVDLEYMEDEEEESK